LEQEHGDPISFVCGQPPSLRNLHPDVRAPHSETKPLDSEAVGSSHGLGYTELRALDMLLCQFAHLGSQGFPWHRGHQNEFKTA